MDTMQCAIRGALAGVVCCALLLLSPPQVAATCGDGIVEVGECCDDGNMVNGDGCDDCVCPTTDHLKCYKIRDAIKLLGIVDLHSPQFGLEPGCTIKKATKFCVPATKIVQSALVNGVAVVPANIGGQNLVNDYICYKIQCNPPTPSDTAVSDQFASRTLSKFKAFELCTPANKCPEAGSFNIATGQLGTTPAGMPDPLPWYLSAAPAGTLNTPPPQPPVAATVIDPNGAWTTFPGTQWVSANTDCTNALNTSCPVGQYSYELCWKQCGPVSIDLQLLADNSATVALNDVTIGGTPSPGFTSPTTVAVPDPGPASKNCLRIDVLKSNTCNDANAEVCMTNADCVAVGATICGGKRCLGGPNNGVPCTTSSECPGGGCGQGGMATGIDVQGSITGSITLISPL